MLLGFIGEDVTEFQALMAMLTPVLAVAISVLTAVRTYKYKKESEKNKAGPSNALITSLGIGCFTLMVMILFFPLVYWIIFSRG